MSNEDFLDKHPAPTAELYMALGIDENDPAADPIAVAKRLRADLTAAIARATEAEADLINVLWRASPDGDEGCSWCFLGFKNGAHDHESDCIALKYADKIAAYDAARAKRGG